MHDCRATAAGEVHFFVVGFLPIVVVARTTVASCPLLMWHARLLRVKYIFLLRGICPLLLLRARLLRIAMVFVVVFFAVVARTTVAGEVHFFVVGFLPVAVVARTTVAGEIHFFVVGFLPVAECWG